MKLLGNLALVMMVTALAAGCGNSSKTTGSNVQAISVNLGPENNYPNGIFTSVTVCAPGTSTCQTINDVLVDSGSYGLRLLGSAVNGVALPQQVISGNSIGECTPFVSSFTWGPVVTADVRIAGEMASSVPVAMIGAYSSIPSFPSPPSACSSGAGAESDTLATLGANGILGIGVFASDCGNSCVSDQTNDIYFACNGGACASTAQSLANQVQNPVALFASDNNGVQIQLPAISNNGEATASGSLIFGIGTQSNNGLGSAQILTTDSGGNVNTEFNGTSYADASFIDSGSNALYFPDSSITQCTGNNAGFYCPASTLSLAATMSGQNGVSVNVPFAVANADMLSSANNGNNAAFNDLAASSDSSGSGLTGDFDWGLPFFYGRNVYFAIAGRNVAEAPVAPFVAY
ncbi:MAG: DUF3443 family protein [Stenotrophobium sp.]